MSETKSTGRHYKSAPGNGGKLKIVLLIIAAVLLIAALVVLGIKFFGGSSEPEVAEPTPTPTAAPTPTAEPTATPEPTPTPMPEKLKELSELHAKNPDIVGWIRIDDTVLDYPVMFTPEDEEKYLRADFDGNFDMMGLPFIDKDCSMDPESDNLIIYGHNMNNGTAFATTLDYADESFWKEHPTIYFATLEEEREYEVLAAFYDRVYFNYEDVFKFYQFIDAEDEADFNNAMEAYREKAEYDTGVTAEYGDDLITLVTCSYHHEYGRFVVVARRVTDENAAAETPAAESSAVAEDEASEPEQAE